MSSAFVVILALASVLLAPVCGAAVDGVQGDLRLALVGMGTLASSRFQGSLERMFYAHDFDGSGSWTAPELEDLLAYAHVGVEAVRPRLAAGVIHSLDVNAPHDMRVTLSELLESMAAVGWTSGGQGDESCHTAGGFCPSLAMSIESGGAVDACCEAWEAGFPRLRLALSNSAGDTDENGGAAGLAPTTPLAPIDNGTLPQDPGCDPDAFARCAREGLVSCQQCDSLTRCNVDGSVTVFHSPHMYGDPAVVATSYLSALVLLEEHAAECRVLLRVVGSYNLATLNVEADGYAESQASRAHAVAFDVKHSRGFCDATCLAAYYGGAALGTATPDLVCFVNRLVAEGNVSVDASRGWVVPAPGSYKDDPPADARIRLALQYSCAATAYGGVGGDAMTAVGLPVAAHSTASRTDGPRMQGAVWNASADCAKAAHTGCDAAVALCHEDLISAASGDGAGDGAATIRSSTAWYQGVAACFVHAVLSGPSGTCSWPTERALDNFIPACAAHAGLCLLSEMELEAAAALLNRTTFSAHLQAAFCSVARRCPQSEELGFTDAVGAVCGSGQHVVPSAVAPEAAPDGATVIAYPAGALIPPAAAVPCGATVLAEYHAPDDGSGIVCETAPLLDVLRAEAGTSTVLAPGVMLWDVLSKHDGLLPSLQVSNAGDNSGTVRNRFFRAHPDVVACVSALRNVLPGEPIEVVRFYETLGEASARGDTNSVYRTGAAVAIAPGHGGTPAQLLQLAEAAADVCLPLAKRRPRRGLGLGLGPRYLQIVFLRLSSRAAPSLTGWTVEDGGATGRGSPLPAADFDALLRGFESRAARRLLGSADSCAQPVSVADARAWPARSSPNFDNGFSPLRHTVPVVNASSKFCASSVAARENGYLGAVADIERLYADTDASDGLRPLQDVLTALRVCYTSCDEGKLFGGNVGERAMRKVQACDALVHWMPVMLASPRDTCHLHTLTNVRMRESACFWGQCLSRQPLYALLSGHFRRFFRAPVQRESPSDPDQLDPAPLFDESRNPTPIFALLSRAHAMECRGRVTVWAENAADLIKQADALRAAMVFNPHVTQVDVRAPDHRVIEVVTALENMILEWRFRICPARGARRHVAAYTVAGIADASLGV